MSRTDITSMRPLRPRTRHRPDGSFGCQRLRATPAPNGPAREKLQMGKPAVPALVPGRHTAPTMLRPPALPPATLFPPVTRGRRPCHQRAPPDCLPPRDVLPVTHYRRTPTSRHDAG